MTDNSRAVDPPIGVAADMEPHLRGGWLVLARIGWVAAVLWAVTFYVMTVPSYYAYLRVLTPTAACNGCLQLSPTDVPTLRQIGLSVSAYAWIVIATRLLVLVGWVGVGAVLFWRASANRVALVASLSLILYAIDLYGPPGGLPSRWPALPGEIIAFLGAVCIGLFFCIFPSGRFISRWTPWLLLAWSAYSAYDIFTLSFPQAPLVRTPSDFAISTSLAACLVATQVYRYRRVSTPTQRQQTKWVVLGVVFGIGGYLAAFLVGIVMSTAFFLGPLTSNVVYTAGTLVTLFIPLGLGIAVLRSRLFDVDVIIRSTLVYGSLATMLVAIYFGVVVGLQSLVTAMTQQTNPQPIFIVASTLLIATLFNPLRRRLQTSIDRRFYRSKYDSARMLRAFATTLRTETNLRELSEQLKVVVEEAMQPASVSLWLREAAKTPMDEHPGGYGRR